MNDNIEKKGKPPETVWFRSTTWAAKTFFPEQSLPWGKLMYACKGLVEVNAEDDIYLSTSEYALWIPPGTKHSSLALNEIKYVIIHFHEDLCKNLPKKVSTLKINGVVKAIIENFSNRNIDYPVIRQDINLSKVLVDQVEMSDFFDSFLPLSEDAVIKKMTLHMLNDNENILTLKEWSQKLGLSERTLSRRFLSSTGISFNEWKLRKKILYAIRLIEEGKSVKFISSMLGYNNPSAFIVMFKKRTGVTPTQM